MVLKNNSSVLSLNSLTTHAPTCEEIIKFLGDKYHLYLMSDAHELE